MGRRLFRYNRFFTVVFLLSFVVSFLILYDGLNLNRQFIQVRRVREREDYRYSYWVQGSWAEGVTDPDGVEAGLLREGRLPMGAFSDGNTAFGNVFLRCEGSVGEGVLNVDDIEVLWAQNEELAEPVKYETYYLDGTWESRAGEIPACIIGDAWEKEIYEVNGIRYIKVMQMESCVVGEFVSDNLRHEDKRCMVFRDSLTWEELDKLLFENGYINIYLESNEADGREALTEWAKTFLDTEDGNFREGEPDLYGWRATDGQSFLMFVKIYQKIYGGLLLFCFLNCAFLAYFWGVSHVYEYMLKRALGYGRFKLFGDVVGQFAVFEGIALGAVLLLTGGYAVARGDFPGWYETIRLGFGQMAGTFALFGTALSLFPMWVIRRHKPAEILKSGE